MYNITEKNGPAEYNPRSIDWTAAQDHAVLAFNVDGDNMPVNPMAVQGLPKGRNGLWHWGPACAADAAVNAIGNDGRRYLLMIERNDGHGWALPGGMLDEGETPRTAAARELEEETGLQLDAELFAMLDGRGVPDPRAGLNAWMETVPAVAWLPRGSMPQVSGRDDARNAAWVAADSYDGLTAALSSVGGQVFAAHVDLIREVLELDVPQL